MLSIHFSSSHSALFFQVLICIVWSNSTCFTFCSLKNQEILTTVETFLSTWKIYNSSISFPTTFLYGVMFQLYLMLSAIILNADMFVYKGCNSIMMSNLGDCLFTWLIHFVIWFVKNFNIYIGESLRILVKCIDVLFSILSQL